MVKLSFETKQDPLIGYPINFPGYPVKLVVKLSGSHKRQQFEFKGNG